ncbi:MAG: hypothetical protein ABIE94_02900 [archaeon]
MTSTGGLILMAGLALATPAFAAAEGTVPQGIEQKVVDNFTTVAERDSMAALLKEPWFFDYYTTTLAESLGIVPGIVTDTNVPSLPRERRRFVALGIISQGYNDFIQIDFEVPAGDYTGSYSLFLENPLCFDDPVLMRKRFDHYSLFRNGHALPLLEDTFDDLTKRTNGIYIVKN